MYLNAYTPPTLVPPPTAESELHEHTLPEAYDLNSLLPIPPNGILETDKVRLEPLIPSLHADALSAAFRASPSSEDDIWFYPFPKGKPYESKVEVLIYMEKQRCRFNVLSFAVIDRTKNQFAGVMSLACDPLQATLDVKILGAKILPAFRGTHVFVHASYLLLSYALDSKQYGGLEVVRVGWRTPPENVGSQKAAEKLGMTREGIMRCYEVSSPMPGSIYPNLTTIKDGTDRVTEDGIVYSMTIHDWLSGKKERLQALM